MPFYETSENTDKIYLKTRWYNNNYTECKKAVIDSVNNLKGFIRDINDEYQEILFIVSFKEVMVKVTTIDDKSAIDIQYNTLFPSKKFISAFYDELYNKLKFYGLSIYA